MTHDPETAERLARRLLWAFGDSPLAALQEARNAALCEAAEAAKGEGESEFFNPVQAIRALIDTPAPPAEPDIRKTTEAMVDAAFRALPADADGTIGSGEMYRVLDAALAAAPDPIQPTPQSDADEREALVTVIEAIDLASNIADALLAAGWTRKREEG